MTNIIDLFSRNSSSGNNLHITLLRHCIETAQLAGYKNRITPSLLHKILETAPRSHKEFASDEWAEKSFCWKILHKIANRSNAGHFAEEEAWRVFNFWTKGFAVREANIRNTLLTQLKMLADAIEGKCQFSPDSPYL